MIEDVLLRQSVNVLDDVFYIYDERGELVFWNDRLGKLFDLTDEQLAGTTPMEFFLEADRPAVERAVEAVFDTGEVVVEARANTTEGTILFELSGRRLTDADGSVVGFCGVGRDVTEQREQAIKLAAQNDRLSEFAAILTHDLRNPLAVAYGDLEGYRTDGDDEQLDSLGDSLDRIGRIIDDVFVIARDGRGVMDAEPVDLTTVARDAWEMVDTADATLDVRTTTTVNADGSRLQRLFENLFRNAVEHAGPSVTVTVTETTAGFAVEDDGPGIAVEDREHVFDPGFSRLTDGTGFGLYIVETIAEAHGWTVAVTEGAAGGVRFEFTVVPGDGELDLVSA
ncbi:PAS domain-containing sensor histidine kinase [Natrinema sp. 1APR25-10V2]|uniref:sensor histidine kinase n=1 Tax=Natrinema sp. 1APR25-10V2 TaxID=2951081 RepID=UPI00287677D1|nr:PAS domain-containing sensor histidine kinase [Natrinema sp. 1APR25-10V2]MDS0473867.1 PAS domain-containing sensor histidine kinase [Natrinema sp. 1APR25-10V2]